MLQEIQYIYYQVHTYAVMTRLLYIQCHSPEDLFFLRDQVNPGDQEGPKSEKQGHREKEGNVVEAGAGDRGEKNR